MTKRIENAEMVYGDLLSRFPKMSQETLGDNVICAG